MQSKWKPIFAVYKVFYLNKEDPTSDIVVREVVKAFGTESEAYAHIRIMIQTKQITSEELAEGWDLDVSETTLEKLWAELQLNALGNE